MTSMLYYAAGIACGGMLSHVFDWSIEAIAVVAVAFFAVDVVGRLAGWSP